MRLATVGSVADKFWARVAVPAEAVGEVPYRALLGMPDGQQHTMPMPSVLLIEERPDGFYLMGYAADGTFAGDTWHQNLEEAQAQATFAYDGYLGPWNPIPADVEDPATYVLGLVR